MKLPENQKRTWINTVLESKHFKRDNNVVFTQEEKKKKKTENKHNEGLFGKKSWVYLLYR